MAIDGTEDHDHSVPHEPRCRAHDQNAAGNAVDGLGHDLGLEHESDHRSPAQQVRAGHRHKLATQWVLDDDAVGPDLAGADVDINADPDHKGPRQRRLGPGPGPAPPFWGTGSATGRQPAQSPAAPMSGCLPRLRQHASCSIGSATPGSPFRMWIWSPPGARRRADAAARTFVRASSSCPSSCRPSTSLGLNRVTPEATLMPPKGRRRRASADERATPLGATGRSPLPGEHPFLLRLRSGRRGTRCTR